MEDKKLKICFFGDAGSIHTLKWIDYFKNEGHDVYLFSYNQMSGHEGIKHFLIKKRLPIDIWPFNTIINLPFTIYNIRKIIKGINPDVIHAH